MIFKRTMESTHVKNGIKRILKGSIKFLSKREKWKRTTQKRLEKSMKQERAIIPKSWNDEEKSRSRNHNISNQFWNYISTSFYSLWKPEDLGNENIQMCFKSAKNNCQVLGRHKTAVYSVINIPWVLREWTLVISLLDPYLVLNVKGQILQAASFQLPSV